MNGAGSHWLRDQGYGTVKDIVGQTEGSLLVCCRASTTGNSPTYWLDQIITAGCS